MTLELEPELEARLCRAAEDNGVDLQGYVRGLLESRSTQGENGAGSLWFTLPPDEWARQFRAWADSHGSQRPPLSDEAVSREAMYGDQP